MATNITFPWMYVPDPTKGRPVFNGDLYIGIVDEDPRIEANQITVVGFQEDGSEIALGQPISTNSGGIPTFNGDPIRIGVSQDYSIVVLNNYGSQVYYDPNVIVDVDPALFQALKEDLTIVDGQLSYSLSTVGLDVHGARIDLAKAGEEVDGTLLIEGTDYTITGAQSFDLVRSYPSGVIRVSNNIVGSVSTSISTTEMLITSTSYISFDADTIVETLGYSQKGVGSARWRKTGVTGLTPSQSPAQLGDIKLTDSTGNEWELVVDAAGVSVDSLGAAGDCTGVDTGTDDYLAYQAALNYIEGGAGRKVINDPSKRYRIGSSVTATAAAKIESQIIFEGRITPDSTVVDAFTISWLRDGEIALNAYESGTDADYTQKDPASATQFLVFRGSRRNKLMLKTNRYAGRLLRTKVATGSEYKLSFNDFNIRSGDQTSVDGDVIGQSYYFEGTSAFGNVSHMVASNEKYGSIADSIVDITYEYLETGTGLTTGYEWRGCGSVWIDNMLLGDETQTLTTALFTVNDALDGCRRVTIQNMLCVQPGIGVHFDRLESSAVDPGFIVNNLIVDQASDAMIKITDSNFGTFRAFGKACNKDAVIEGTSRNISGEVKSRNARKNCVQILDTASNIDITGSNEGASQVAPGMHPVVDVRSVGENIVFNDFTIQSDVTAGSYDIIASNNVRIQGGRAEAQPVFTSAAAKRIRNLEGYRNEFSGVATILSGNTSVTVTHTMDVLPETVQSTGRTSSEVASTWVSAIGATTFDINVPSAVTGDRSVMWEAKADDYNN